MVKTKDAGKTQPAKSEEHITDSSSESESESPTKDAASSQNSEISKRDVISSDSDGSSGGGSDGNGSSTSSSSSKRKRPSSKQTISHESHTKKSKVSHTVSNTRTATLEPPTGYNHIKLDAADFVSETSGMFSNLDGKQVWHITAPASVPIDSIRSLDIQAALRGEPILHSKGTSYDMFTTIPKGQKLLIPSSAQSMYSQVKVDISKGFSLREMPQAKVSQQKASPTSSAEPHGVAHSDLQEDAGFFAVAEGTKKPHRQQPSGLLMRYQPYGGAIAMSKPYKLSHPESVDEVESSQLEVRTPHKSKSGDINKVNGVSDSNLPGSGITVTSEVPSAPSSKLKKSSKVSGSERKKRKKDRKEEA